MNTPRASDSAEKRAVRVSSTALYKYAYSLTDE